MGRVGGVEAKGAESEGENQRGPRSRCRGGGVGGVKANGWSRRGRSKGGGVGGGQSEGAELE
jgi:hypothetical protein